MGKRTGKSPAKAAPESLEPRSLAIAQKGIRTANEFAFMMSALMSDLIEGAVTSQVGNAVVNAGGKLLKAVELQAKYGTQGKGQEKELTLVKSEPLLVDASEKERKRA